LDINQEIVEYLKKHPKFIYNISSRKFEELIAHIIKHLGFDVELTPTTRDGGRDILAYIRNAVCSFLTFVECKHYSMDNPVGVGIVRGVYGVQRIYRANKSLIVTSSYFTKGAIELTKPISNEVELKDHSDIQIWLKKIS
jgi:HJR/Mrr/RecB family endonuclease